jgi:lipopolysaccharide export system protein LptA
MSRSTKLQRLSRAAGLTLWCLLAGQALALPSDRNQAITIHSDSAERDEIKGTITYSGNVVMQQGSMRIDADEVVIVNDKSKVTQIVATGQPARYQQKPNEDEGPVVAQANRLEYNIAQDTLHLIENALLQQEGTSLSGHRIDYDVKKSVVKAGSDANQNERVKMVIPARSLKQQEEE